MFMSCRTLRKPATSLLASLLLVLFALPLSLWAQQEVLNKEAYLTPPKEIADAVLASRNDNVSLTNISPDGKKFLIVKNDGLPALERLAHPYVHLAESTFNNLSGRSRDMYVRSNSGYDLYYYADNRTVPVQVPAKARVSNPL